MAVSTQAELIGALNAGEYEKVLGTAECAWLDAKQSPYKCEPGNPSKLSPEGRYELCKDISAFANDSGGVVLIGVKEKLSPTSGESVADKITPVKVAAIRLAHYKQAVLGNVYPIVTEIEWRWY